MQSQRASRKSRNGMILAAAISVIGMPALAQDAEETIEEVVVTGTRIQNQNVIAASPVTTIDMEEISLKQTPNIERVFRDLPITIPGDGENVNNGTAGQATINLRALGDERSLTLINGHRLAPYDIDGISTVDVIPINMVRRVDVVTGGASAVYGSDAMSGAINFVLRDDFEGVEIDVGYSDTDSSAAVGGGGEDTHYINVLFGLNFDDDRGNITVGGGRTKRGSILLGDREFGLFGVSSTTGSGLSSAPPAPPAECSGNTDFATSFESGVGSTTAIPGTLNLRTGSSLQFRDDMTLVDGACARFNFNPFNYYQTPQDRWQAMTVANYSVNENLEAYATVLFSANESAFQIAPSGTFGAEFTIPVMNPFFNDGARQLIINDLNAGAMEFVTTTSDRIAELQGLPNPTPEQMDELAAQQAALAADPMGFGSAGIQDINGDGVFDAADAFTSTARRRTLELGPRTGIFDTDFTQTVVGLRGSFPGNFDNWNFDVSFNRGESDFVETRDGFTNLTNLAAGINTVDPDTCISATGVVTPPPCTPINVFGPNGSITDEQRDSGFFIAIASDIRRSEQQIYSATIDGTIDQARLPTAADGLSLAFGAQFLEIEASSSPDECLKLAPASCQGGAGGNRLPINGAYESDDYFIEAILPIAQDRPGFENLSLEAGWRTSDYDIQGSVDTWKAGLSWEIVPGFRLRAMEQEAVRVPNVGELFSPITTGLDNATFDPCSIGNPNPPQPGTELFQRCVQTGMLPSQVGQVPDIISGQINVFNGTNPSLLPEPEEASTTTIGFVWQPELAFSEKIAPTTISLDWYDIEIEGFIDEPSGQEALDDCYVAGNPDCLAGVVRLGGSLTVSGTGVPAFFTNFQFFKAEGIDLSVNTGYDLGNIGQLGINWTAHKYLTNEFQTTAVAPVVDCSGFYGTSCDPVPEFRSTVRFNWSRNDLNASLLWRRIGEMDAQEGEAAALFPAFRSVDAQDYFDLSIGYRYQDLATISFLVYNLADEEPPILGNNTGSTAFNSGNTFPSLFDTVGRTFSVNLKLAF